MSSRTTRSKKGQPSAAPSLMAPTRSTGPTRSTAAPLSLQPHNVRQPRPPPKDETIARICSEYQYHYDKGEDAKNNVVGTRRSGDLAVFGATFDSHLVCDRCSLKEMLRII